MPETPDTDAAVAEELQRSSAEVHFSQYWAVLVKRKILIAIVLAAVLGGCVLSALLQKPLYKATVTLDIEKETHSPFDVSDSPNYWSWDPEFLPTQTKLMRSRQVAERAAERLNLVQDPEYREPRNTFFAGNRDDSRKKPSPLTKAAISVQGGLEVQPVRGTNLVELSFTGGDPQRAADIANAVADAYIDWNLEAKYAVIGQASKFITAQIEQLKSEVGAKEKQLQAYGRQKGIVSTDPQQNSTLQNLSSLNSDYAAAVGDRVTKEARYHELLNAKPETVADTLSNGLVSQLRGDQAKLERDYAEKLNLFKPEWPAMQQLKAQIDKGRQHLDQVIQETVEKARDSARNEYLTALRREQSLQGVLQGQKSEALDMNLSAVEYNNLRVEVETKRTLLDSLLKREAETQMTSRLRGEKVSTIRVVDRALPPTFRSSPSYQKSATTGVVLGMLLGCALAFFLEYLDRSLRTAGQVEQALMLPALGVIPAVGTSVLGYGYSRRRRRQKKVATADGAKDVAIELLPHDQQRSTVAEAYRAFRASLLLSRAGGIKSIVVTSSLPSEGKTSTAVNLAIVLGQLQKRVLLIDADLHKPRLHEVVRISNRVGLVSALATDVSPEEVVTKTNLPGVFVVPAGPQSPNPSGLLSSERMAEFLNYAREYFDYVVIDTPPVSPVADALILGSRCDGVVLCVQAGRTPREVVARVRDKFLRSRVRVLGVLLNNLNENEGVYSYYYRYYGYAREAKNGTYGYTHEVLPKAAGSQ